MKKRYSRYRRRWNRPPGFPKCRRSGRGPDPMADRLAGKVAIVTGAASRGEGVGHGAATAILFAREGAKVVLVNRDAARAEALAEQIRAEGGEASAFAADVTQQDA